MTKDKRMHGQYYTIRSPFDHPVFRAWAAQAFSDRVVLVEPFVGGGDIVRQVMDIGITSRWVGYDIAPSVEGGIMHDSIQDFPVHHDGVVITNPPWLAKNSARRHGWHFPDTPWSDLYQVALARALDLYPYVAMILPESFITARFPKDRCAHIISLRASLFDDTDHPTCMVLCVPNPTDCYVWDQWECVGTLNGMQNILSRDVMVSSPNCIRFNIPTGSLGLYAVDGTVGPNIRFVPGDDIPASVVSHAARAVTRIAIDGYTGDAAFIDRTNAILMSLRAATHDVGLTAFRGLRRDGRYRRRLDYGLARYIINAAMDVP